MSGFGVKFRVSRFRQSCLKIAKISVGGSARKMNFGTGGLMNFGTGGLMNFGTGLGGAGGGWVASICDM